MNQYPKEYKESVFKSRIHQHEELQELSIQAAHNLCAIRTRVNNKPFKLGDTRFYMDPDDHETLDELINAVYQFHKTLKFYQDSNKELLEQLAPTE